MNASWKYETAQDLDLSLTERLHRFPRQPDMLVYAVRSAAALLLRGWLRLYHRFRISGQENLPQNASFALVANHSSHLDALCLLAALPLRSLHRAFPAAATDYFFESVPRTWLAAVVVNALPFSREVHMRQSLGLCEHLLRNPGNILIFFPEGSRSATGALGKFKPGVGLLLAGSAIPALPCRLDGAFTAWPKGRSFPRPSRVTLRIGKPRTYHQLPRSRESACEIANDLQTAVEQMGTDHDHR